METPHATFSRDANKIAGKIWEIGAPNATPSVVKNTEFHAFKSEAASKPYEPW